MIGPGRRQALVEDAGVELMALGGQLGGEFPADAEQPLMGPVGLVGREEIGVAAEAPHMGQRMGRVADPVHHRARARAPRDADDRRDVVDLSHHVRRMREGDQRHLPVRQQLAQGFGIEMAVRVHAPLADLDPVGGEPAPGPRVGLVVLIGHDDRAAARTRGDPLANRVRQHVDVRGGRGSEGELVGVEPQHRREPPAGLIHLLAARGRDRIGHVGLYFALPVEAMQAPDHVPAGIGPPGAFEEGRIAQRRFLEGRELRADVIEV